LLAALLPALVAAEPPPAPKYFEIRVVDEETGRGVPLVELETVHHLRYWTDSNGLVAFHEPGLMGQKVFFHVKSHGYEFPKDGFGYRGAALEVKEGGSARLKIKRVNLAERLYRVTGAGIYADSLLLGRPVPLHKPALNGLVLGSDSVVNALYRDKVYWFWGDTNQPGYPLGNFHVPGATSALPGQGGLDPETGIDLDYYLDDKGFARPTARMPGEGPTWLSALVVLRDGAGKERLFAAYAKVRKFLEVYERGLVEFNDEKRQFEKVVQFPADAPVRPDGHPFLHREDGKDYVYFAAPYPLLRARADLENLRDPGKYEAFTCLEEGTRPEQKRLDRDKDGAVRYRWKRTTPAVGPGEQAALLRAGLLKPEEALLQLQDAVTGKRVSAHSGSVYWNKYRGRWVLIAVEMGGSSLLGEVWYAEADTPLGPWVYARKVVTHERYSFYNPKQHPMFDKEGGRVIFFEGTYTSTFSGNPDATPRYDYNQVLYKLDLGRPQLALPVPVYHLDDKTSDRFATLGGLRAGRPQGPIAFFALDRPGIGTVPVYEEQVEGGGWALRVGTAEDAKGGKTPLCHALAADVRDGPATAIPLYEFDHEDGKKRAYSVDASWSLPGYRRTKTPLCFVWKNPLRS
jgi:hypothetical protein